VRCFELGVITTANQFRFLTLLQHLLHVVFLGIMLFVSVVNLVREKSYRSSNLDTLFALVWTCSSMVGVLFWSIVAYDRDLIFPKELDMIYPVDINLFHHGFIPILMWMEWAFFQYQIEYSKHIKPIIIFYAAYTIWVYIQKYIYGNYPYNLFNFLSIPGHIIFNGSVMVVTLVLFYGFTIIHQKRWGKNTRRTPTPTSTKKKLAKKVE